MAVFLQTGAVDLVTRPKKKLNPFIPLDKKMWVFVQNAIDYPSVVPPNDGGQGRGWNPPLDIATILLPHFLRGAALPGG